MSPARVSQILGLLKLAPEVQDLILRAEPFEVGERGVSERRLRALVGEDWEAQVQAGRCCGRRGGDARCGHRGCTEGRARMLARAEQHTELLVIKRSVRFFRWTQKKRSFIVGR